MKHVICKMFIFCLHNKYRILGILFLGLTLSRGISGSPDISRDKVSPKNKMPANLIYPVIKSVPKTKCLIFCLSVIYN